MRIMLFAICMSLFSLSAKASEGLSPKDKALIKKEFSIDLDLTNDQLTQNEARLEYELGDFDVLAKRGDETVAVLVRLSVFVLRLKGHRELANEIEHTHANRFMHQLSRLGKLGDHEPYSQWLAETYQKIEAKLGKRICELLHLDDINIVNFAIPVVFQPRGDERNGKPLPWGIEEYAAHFVPFGGVVGYWSAWSICTGATWGAGAIVFICTPTGMLTERVTVNRIAPPISDRIYNRYN